MKSQGQTKSRDVVVGRSHRSDATSNVKRSVHRFSVAACVLALGLTAGCAQPLSGEQADSDANDSQVAGGAGSGSTEPVASTAQALLGAKASMGYVWANNATASSYTPSAFYSSNSAGGTNTISKLGTGRYRVYMPSLAAPGNAQVSAYGTTANRCALYAKPYNSSSRVVIDVYCYNYAGTLTNSTFTVFYTNTFSAGWIAFGTSSSSGTLGNDSYFAAGGRRGGIGSYTIELGDSPLDLFEQDAHVAFATAIGSSGAYCSAQSMWGKIYVNCFDKSGRPADSAFSFLWLYDASFAGSNIAYSPFRYSESWAFDGYYSNSNAFEMTYNTIGATGSNTLSFYDHGLRSPTIVLVGGMDGATDFQSGSWCNPTGWGFTTGEFAVAIKCFDAKGNAVFGDGAVTIIGKK